LQADAYNFVRLHREDRILVINITKLDQGIHGYLFFLNWCSVLDLTMAVSYRIEGRGKDGSGRPAAGHFRIEQDNEQLKV